MMPDMKGIEHKVKNMFERKNMAPGPGKSGIPEGKIGKNLPIIGNCLPLQILDENGLSRDYNKAAPQV